MFETMLFLHLVCLVLWFGSMMASASVILLSKRQIVANETKELVRKLIRVFGWLTYPTSIMVLVSGILMIIEMNFEDAARPMWLSVMEKGGSVIILAAILITAIMGGKLSKRLKPSVNHSATGVTVGGSVYLTSLFISLVAIFIVILIVSLRI